MPEITTIKTNSKSGNIVESRLFRHENASSLLVILPGKGYLVDYPLLYYLREIALAQGIDVLSLNYSFQTGAEAFEDLSPGDLSREVDQALASLSYEQVCFAGKSLGTPLAVHQAHKAPNTRLILLTPVGDAVQSAGTIPTLAIIGTADPYYDAAKITESETITWLVLDNLNHSLEKRGNWAASLQALQDVMVACDSFLRK